MTIDQMLAYLPQLSERKSKLATMQRRLPKKREQNAYSKSNVIDYRYANYDVEETKKAYASVSDRLAKAQTALDLVNGTETFEI